MLFLLAALSLAPGAWAGLDLQPGLRHDDTWRALRSTTTGPAAVLNDQPHLLLAGMTTYGRPVYYEEHSRVAAQSIQLDELWPGGDTQLQLDGLGVDHMGMWDSGSPRITHVELAGRVETQDNAASVTSHSQSVAGILVSSGLNSAAHGMAPAALLKSWDWNDDQTEMMDAAWQGLRVSNHSYGASVGWGLVSNTWYWYGDPALSPVEDADFGYYNATSSFLDELAWLEPRYLTVRSAGNHRLDVGPAPGVPHFVYQGGWQQSFDVRDPDGGVLGFDTLPPEAVSKNGLVVGAVSDLPLGWTDPASALLTSFTSYGPTDDGRIKPDLVANGTTLVTPGRSSNTDYVNFSGTSAAAPTVAGAASLLTNLFSQGHLLPDGSPRAPLSSTVKGLLIHTADEVGLSPGPDYQAGWGLVNARTAALLLNEDNQRRRRILEGTLTSMGEAWIHVRSLGGPARLTLCWTDYPAIPRPPALDDSSPRLVHDLNMTVQSGTTPTTWRAWALDPQYPDHPAQAVGNHLDNVERIDWTPLAGQYFSILLQAGMLQAPQAWSLLLSGVEPVAKLRMQSARTLAALDDTLWLDVELEGGLAVRGVDLDLRWPAGALLVVDVEAGEVLSQGGIEPQVEVLESGSAGLRVRLDRLGDNQGLTLPSGVVARLRLVLRSLSPVRVDLSASRLVGVGGDTDQAVDWELLQVNPGADPEELEFSPLDLE